MQYALPLTPHPSPQYGAGVVESIELTAAVCRQRSNAAAARVRKFAGQILRRSRLAMDRVPF
jgi:hypothetical protein